MSSFMYWPYDEVSLNESAGELTLKTPWIEAISSADLFDPAHIASLKNKINDKTLCANDIFLVNNFFKNFYQFPLAYILPAQKPNEMLDTHSLMDLSNLSGDLDSILFRILLSNKKFNENEAEKLLTILARRSFEWDQDAALSFASINKTIHPESIFSVARRYHLLELLKNDRGSEIFSLIKKRSPQEFRFAVARLVRQNHYVTEQCQSALMPALAIAQQAKTQVEEFMAAERGHDKILKKALRHLELKPEDIEVSVQTKALMAVLEYLAERNFLAFAMAVDAFERNNYEDVDPIAQLLVDGGFEEAASFINLHMKINDQGGHENVAQQFLHSMALCNRDYALEALRLMELLSVVMCSVSESAGA